MKYNTSKVLLLNILLTCLIYSSCANDRKIDPIQAIKVNIENKQTEKNVKIKDVIPLETSMDCLIGYTTKVIYWNNRIILLDHNRSKTMFLFNGNGKLIFKTLLGKGPGEVSAPKAVNINKIDSTILLFDETKRMLCNYNLEGNYLGNIQIPTGIFIKDFFPISKDTLLVYYSKKITAPNGKKRQTTYTVYTNDFSDEKHLGIYVSPNKISQSLNSPVAFFKNEILFVAPWSYNIYELKGDDYRTKYSFDFGEAALTPWQIESLSSYELIPLIHEGNKNKIGCLKSVFINDSFLIIVADYGLPGLNIIYSFKDKKVCNLNNYFGTRLLPVCRIWGINNDGSIYALVDASDFVDFNKLSSGIYNHLGIEKTDNPVLITFNFEN